MHRRTNSYSYTAAERVPPAWPDFNYTASCSEGFARASKERRSLDRIQQPLPVPSKLRHPGYLAVNISHTVPAAIKYAIGEDASFRTPLPCKIPPPAILTMQRPRSPSKSSRMGVSSENTLLDQALADIKEQLLGLKMQRNSFVERVDSLQRGIHRTREDMLQCRKEQQLQQTTTADHQNSLRRIHSLEGHAQSYVHSAVRQTKVASSPREEAGESSLNSSLPPPNGTPNQPRARFSPEWKNRNSMPVIPSYDIASQATSLNGLPPRRNSGQSSKKSSKALPTIIDQKASSGCDDLSSEEGGSPTATSFSNSAASKVLVAPCKSSRHQHSSRNQATFESCTLPHLPVTAPASTLQNVKEDESSDSVSCSDSLVDELSQGSMVMQVSSATGQLEQVPKAHHSTKKQNSSYANLTWQNSTSSHTNRKNLPDMATIDRANAVILRLAQEPCRSPRVYRMRKANSIILNSVETIV